MTPMFKFCLALATIAVIAACVLLGIWIALRFIVPPLFRPDYKHEARLDRIDYKNVFLVDVSQWAQGDKSVWVGVCKKCGKITHSVCIGLRD